ncbi:pilus assembly protein [Paenibacillus agaridevorans]|uniref:Pilus assembly protein n=1 Tax=Paenibacillus agaridevorans TaxID=171404 RepID=A0A2R5ENZ0_9BACL|nr:ATPase, T2SS/T4P/T4SS family [Paenibacillus agaridevorans]GBG06718.1 pilus assembly protein [Paenibacillus agaridevorans]
MPPDESIAELRSRIRASIDFTASITDEELLRKTECVVFEWPESRFLSAADKVKLVKRLYHSFRGLDLLQPLMEDPLVNEIMINGHKDIFVERQGEMTKLRESFESEERLQDLIQRIVAGVNRIVNESSPIVDARLPDGSRVHVVLPPVSLSGPCVTIRKFPERPMSMKELVEKESLTTEAAFFLQELVEAKYNIFISGGTGTGKTTFLNALSQHIPSEERIITIEDSAELQIASVPNLVSLETKNSNTEGKGSVTIRELIRASLRMRPNRIIVGEVRGEEAIDMLQALNTGHEGSISTGHGNSALDMMGRLETMVLGAAELPLPVIRGQIASAIDIVIHLSRGRDRRRRVMEICEMGGVEEGRITLNPLFVRGELEEGASAGHLLRTEVPLARTNKLRAAGKEAGLI